MDKVSSWTVPSIIFAFISSAYGGEFCRNYYDTLTYCTYGCCGYLNRDCCSPSVGLIAGMIVLGILVVSVIIAVVCCIRRRRGVIGRVINANSTVTTTVVQSGQTTMTAGPIYPPQTYGAAAYGPPQYPPGVYPQPYPPPVQQYGPSAPPYAPPAQPYPMPQPPNPPPYEAVSQYQGYKE
ncbi:protein shisa-5-like [Pomacea canaliculata]|uniref:protein shisa-5-like n=1 Tax=Pomacea canaliculata TaxID=400727 RepID=UPI000D73EBD9|nr:protein shisa-5-like [Pomacea canaliculata]